jgi:4'-phosphopantetheinyl transferase
MIGHSEARASLGAWTAPPPPPLGECSVHVWRIRLDDEESDTLWSVLSSDERERARRFHFDMHRRAFVVAHAAMRRVLAWYANVPAASLVFTTGEFGKPALAGVPRLQFNLSHSGDFALLAVSQRGEVGVDVEQWNAEADHLNLADHFFSEGERAALRGLADASEQVVAGFFAAWSRKEAYLKASGHGISRGLHHFNVSLLPGEPARLIADELDDLATDRWVMCELPVGDGYSAAVVATAPVDDILLFDAERSDRQ